MDNVEFRDLKNWLSSRLEDAPGVLAAFSGSYSSAVGLALLMKCYKGPIDPVFICVKDDVWRGDLAEEWLSRLGCKSGLRRMIFNETVDDLEEQVPDLYETRQALLPGYVLLGLEMLSRTFRYSVAWFGDRNVAVTSGIPQTTVPFYAPLSRLPYQEVRALGKFLSVDDGWLRKWDGIPSGWYTSFSTRYQKFDRLVGWALAHREDIRDISEDGELNDVIFQGGQESFKWMGWVPEDTYDRVTLVEIVNHMLSSHRVEAQQFGVSGDSTQMLNSGYTMHFTGNVPQNPTLLGSVRVQADASMSSSNLLLSGINDSGQKLAMGVSVPSEKICSKLLSKFSGQTRDRLHVRLSAEGETDHWYLLSLSEEGIRSFQKALEDILSYLSILPEEIIDGPLTKEEQEERIARSRELAEAPRPRTKRH